MQPISYFKEPCTVGATNYRAQTVIQHWTASECPLKVSLVFQNLLYRVRISGTFVEELRSQPSRSFHPVLDASFSSDGPSSIPDRAVASVSNSSWLERDSEEEDSDSTSTEGDRNVLDESFSSSSSEFTFVGGGHYSLDESFSSDTSTSTLAPHQADDTVAQFIWNSIEVKHRTHIDTDRHISTLAIRGTQDQSPSKFGATIHWDQTKKVATFIPGFLDFQD